MGLAAIQNEQSLGVRLKTICRFYVVLLAASVLVSACVPARVPTPAGRVPLSSTVEMQLFDRVQVAGRMFRSLEGVAKVHVVWQGKNATVTQALLVEKPDRFRSETLNPFGFGSPLMLMATDGSELAVMVPGEGLMFRGEASSRNLQRFTSLPLQPADLVHLLLYQVPVIPYKERIGSLGAAGDYLLQLQGTENRRQELWFDKHQQLVESAYYNGDELALRVKYGNFSVGEFPFPHFSFMEMPQQQAEASLTFSELATNVVAEAQRFHLTTPEGYEERSIP
jgi:outer membrane lipoprotein-sorting protein